ncbi:DUF2304 domain-containing protein [Streptomyces sp. Li-HN-5-11]|nr:DUF2304 domain-containing protein [Streptomyces sp. Li-HN-5-11]WNM29222.1 DUF2304 domain-containing protein [Streptomyces sp. Li-HN-5-11]
MGSRRANAVVCALFGLYLAGTQNIGPFAKDVTASVAHLLSGLRL